MTREDRLKSCRYYKGEAENPFTDRNEHALWWYESFWVSTGDSQDAISEYRAYVKNDKHPNIPIGLKALLFNRISRTSYGGDFQALSRLTDILDRYYKWAPWDRSLRWIVLPLWLAFKFGTFAVANTASPPRCSRPCQLWLAFKFGTFVVANTAPTSILVLSNLLWLAFKFSTFVVANTAKGRQRPCQVGCD